MSASKNKTSLHLHIVVPVATVILGALSVVGLATYEDWRFGNACEQISQLVDLVRSTASSQKSFAQSASADLFGDLQRAGQIVTPSAHANPWGGQIRMMALSNAYMRLETELPTHDCRRVAQYFVERDPAKLGLFGIEGAPVTEGANWAAIYPVPPGHMREEDTAQIACGNASEAHLALVFRMR